MKRIWKFLLLVSLAVVESTALRGQTPSPVQAIHLATSLDHLTVLEYAEPVTLAAAGSSAFSIEWRGNKVLIKPLKAGAATDLFVWTATQRYAYELDPPGEVKVMNFALDNPTAKTKPQVADNTDSRMSEVADMVLTRAFLGADRIENGSIKARKGQIVLRIENVFQSANGLYLRYSIENLTAKPYRVGNPSLFQIVPIRPTISLTSIRRMQLDDSTFHALGEPRHVPLPVAASESRKQDLAPEESTQGVIVLHQQFMEPTVLQLSFPNAGTQHVTANFVF